MRRLLPEEQNIYRLQDYAIIQHEDGKYEYVAWEEDKTTGALTWIRGIAVIVEQALCLASITSDGKEENIDSRLELKYELGQLPVWEKTKYYCVVLGGMASLLKYSGTGNALKDGSQEFKMAQDMLKKYGIVPPTE